MTRKQAIAGFSQASTTVSRINPLILILSFENMSILFYCIREQLFKSTFKLLYILTNVSTTRQYRFQTGNPLITLQHGPPKPPFAICSCRPTPNEKSPKFGTIEKIILYTIFYRKQRCNLLSQQRKSVQRQIKHIFTKKHTLKKALDEIQVPHKITVCCE